MLLIGVYDYRKVDVGYCHGDGFLGGLHRTKVGNHSLTHSLTSGVVCLATDLLLVHWKSRRATSASHLIQEAKLEDSPHALLFDQGYFW